MVIANAKNEYINYSRTVTSVSCHDREISEEIEGSKNFNILKSKVLGLGETKVPKTFHEMFIAKGLVLIATV